jgi:transposase
MLILAIDLAKAKSLFCWYQTSDPTQEPKQELKTVLSTPQAFHDAFLLHPVDRVVIEVCDMAGWIVDLCQTLSIPIQVVNVNVEGWRWKNVKNKTDKADVLKLARLSAADDLQLVHLPDRPTRQRRSLILYRQKLIERRTAVKNSIHALLVAEGRAMKGRAKGGRDAFSADSIASLRKLLSDDLWSMHLELELDNLDHLNEQIKKLSTKLDALGDVDHRVIRLQTIPGVGPRLSELVVVMIDDPHRFKNARQVSAYAGLTPRRYQSGQMDRNGRISKAGCGKLRKLLVEVAWGMLKHNEHGSQIFGTHQQRTKDPAQAGGGRLGASRAGVVLGDAA